MTRCEDIRALVDAFERCTLPRERYTHAAHLACALVYLCAYPRGEATRRMREGIRRFNAAVGGSPAAYHETMTLAWLAVVARFVREHDRGQPLGALFDALVAACGDKHYLARFYSPELLMSAEARARWIEPDLTPIDDAAVAA